MTKRVKKLNNELVGIFFDYSPTLVALVKSLPGRAYEPRLKAWLLPVDGLLNDNLKRLSQAGFDVSEVVGLSTRTEPKTQPINDLNALVLPSNATLRPFQVQGVKSLLEGNLLLGDEPGLGKTIQALTAVHSRKLNRVLVLTFASLKFQFRDEIKKFFPSSSVVVVDGNKKERTLSWKKTANFYVANYELLLRDLELMTEKKWDAILADECTRLSNPRNKQFKCLKFLRSDFRVAMTGTAISNSPLDVFGIFDWLRPGVLGTYYSFLDRYVVKNMWGGNKYFKNLEELVLRIKPFYIRRTKKQVLLELPDKIKIDLPVLFSPEEDKLYSQIKEQMLLEIEKKDISKILNPVMLQSSVVNLIRLRQLADSMELLGEKTQSSKLNALKDLLSTLGERKRIIFSEFAHMCKILNRELPGSLMIIGEVKSQERDEIVKKFNSDSTCQTLIMSSAGAYGLNLQAADVIVHYDLPFSIAKYEQRSARAHRMGQKNVVYEYSLVVENSVDKWIKKKLENKQDLSEMLITLTDVKEILTV